MSSCPPVPPLPIKDKVNDAADIAKAMGMRSCETSQMSATAHAELDVPFASAEIEMTANKSSTIGCEQLTVLADKINKSQNDIQCLIKKTSSNVTKKVSGINSIVFDARDTLDIKCGESLKIKQGITIDMVDISQITVSTKQEIAKVTKDVVDIVGKTLMDSKTGLGATPQGQKTIQQTVSGNDKQDYFSQVSETLNNIDLQTQGGNTILFQAKNIYLSGKSCDIDQSIILKIISTTIIMDALSNAYSGISEDINKIFQESQDKADNKGAESLSKWGEKMNWMMIIGVLIICCCCICLLFIVMLLFKKSK